MVRDSCKEIQARLDRMKEIMDQINSDLEREWRLATGAYRNQVEATCYHLVRQLKDKAHDIPDDRMTQYIRQILAEHLAPVYQELNERMREISRRCVMQARTAEADVKEVLIRSLSTWGCEDGADDPASKAAGEEDVNGADQTEADSQSDGNLPVPTTPSVLSNLPTWDWDRDLGPVANWALPVGLTTLLFLGPIAALAGAAGAGYIAYRQQFDQRHREAKLAAIEELADSLSQQAATQIQLRVEEAFDELSQAITGQLESSIEVVARQLKQAQEEAQRTDQEREQLLQSLLATDRELKSVTQDLQRIRLELAHQALNEDSDHSAALLENGSLEGTAGFDMASERV